VETAVVALRVALSLGVVFGLMWFLHRRLSRGAGARGASTPITVLAQQAVGPKSSVVVIDVEGKRLVLGVTEHSVSVLNEAEAPEAPAFADVLAATPAERATAPHRADTTVLPGRRAARAGSAALAGSILSRDTWRQAAAALGRGK
jgi:flagellar protein FliO/FliZ